MLAYVGMFCAPGSQEDEDNQVFQLLEASSASHGLGYSGRWRPGQTVASPSSLGTATGDAWR